MHKFVIHLLHIVIHFVYFAHCSCSYVCIYTFQGPLFFGLRGPNAEPPSGGGGQQVGGTAGCGNSNRNL